MESKLQVRSVKLFPLPSQNSGGKRMLVCGTEPKIYTRHKVHVAQNNPQICRKEYLALRDLSPPQCMAFLFKVEFSLWLEKFKTGNLFFP